MKREELDRLAELEAKATPGPQKITRASRGDYITLSGDDARLAVALRNAAPALLAAAREAEEWKAKALRWDAERQIIGGHYEDLRAALHRTEAEVKELRALTRDLLARVTP